MLTDLTAYHGNPREKRAILAQLRRHRKADELVKGQYWEDGKGCAVACTIHGSDHSQYEPLFGIPQILARLEDRLFEGLPNDLAQAWPERFMGAIAPGADLTMVWPRFAHWLLTEEVPPRTNNKPSLASLAEVGTLYREWIDGAKPAAKRWLSARRTAAAFASASASAAFASASASAAFASASASAAFASASASAAFAAASASAADASASASASAAFAAASASAADASASAAFASASAFAAASAASASASAAFADAYAARRGSYTRQADKLIELLQAAPVKEVV